MAFCSLQRWKFRSTSNKRLFQSIERDNRGYSLLESSIVREPSRLIRPQVRPSISEGSPSLESHAGQCYISRRRYFVTVELVGHLVCALLYRVE